MVRVEKQSDIVAAFEAKGEPVNPFYVMTPYFEFRGEGYYVHGCDTAEVRKLVCALIEIIKLYTGTQVLCTCPLERVVEIALEGLGIKQPAA